MCVHVHVYADTLFNFSSTSDTKHYFPFLLIFFLSTRSSWIWTETDLKSMQQWLLKYLNVSKGSHEMDKVYLYIFFCSLSLMDLAQIYLPYAKTVSSSFKNMLFIYNKNWTFHLVEEK